MGISASKQGLVCTLFRTYLGRTVHITDKFNEKRQYFWQGKEYNQHFLGNFSLGPLPNHQALHCPLFCSYPNIPRNCPILRTFKILNQSLFPYALGISNKRAKVLRGELVSHGFCKKMSI